MNIAETQISQSSIKNRKILENQMVDGAFIFDKKAELGQFMTPDTIAEFMASLFKPHKTSINIIDAGAGDGALSKAFINRWGTAQHIELTAYEIDPDLNKRLKESLLEKYSKNIYVIQIKESDFIQDAVGEIKNKIYGKYTHAILNPPYKKIQSKSSHRNLLSSIGIETVNLYSAFVALSLRLLNDKGQLVAIIPRSFCNGPYFLSFRKLLLEQAAVRQIHLFTSRKKAFEGDGVLQENIILSIERGGSQGEVMISKSTDASFSDYTERAFSFSEIVIPRDRELCIHIPLEQDDLVESSNEFSHDLKDIGVQVSTGPVVDFRLKEFLRDQPEEGTVPLIYPVHFGENRVEWPKPRIKKSNAIVDCIETKKWLYPNGYYVAVKRVSSKEEKRRIVARVVIPDTFGTPMLGFENHLNIFHLKKTGLSQDLVYGITAYLNSTVVDNHFRRVSGHTQVNVADLRRMPYPSREKLLKLGQWAMVQANLDQDDIDQKVESIS